MKRLPIIFLTILLIACAAKPLAVKIPTGNDSIKNVIKLPFDSVWDHIMYLAFEKGYTIKSKDRKEGTIVLITQRVPVTYLDKSGNPQNDTSFAFTEQRRRVNNFEYVYALKGTLEWNILIQSSGDRETISIVRINNKGTLNEYYQNGYVAKRAINNVNIWTTGVFEKILFESMKNK